MRFEEEHTYEVWYQTGGFEPEVHSVGLTKAEAEALIKDMTERDKRRRPEAMPIHYMVVCASTTRREVH